jgi:hypothetical protein
MLVKLEDILIEMGYMHEDDLIKSAGKHREKFFNYYSAYDPTWKPE